MNTLQTVKLFSNSDYAAYDAIVAQVTRLLDWGLRPNPLPDLANKFGSDPNQLPDLANKFGSDPNLFGATANWFASRTQWFSKKANPFAARANGLAFLG